MVGEKILNEGKKEGTKEGTKEVSKEERKEERKEGRKEERKEERKEGRNEGGNDKSGALTQTAWAKKQIHMMRERKTTSNRNRKTQR